MRQDQFIATVTDRGAYLSPGEAEHATLAVLRLLGECLMPGEAEELAARLPQALARVVTDAAGDGVAEPSGVEEFLRRLAADVNGTEETARWDASAVLSTVADAVSDADLHRVIGRLPAGYAELFGRPALV